MMTMMIPPMLLQNENSSLTIFIQIPTENVLNIKPNTNSFKQSNNNPESLPDININAKHVEIRRLSEKTNTTQEKPTIQEGNDLGMSLKKLISILPHKVI